MEVSSSIRKKLQATIPEDVIIEFLLRLPVKALLRFKLVCKTWYNLIKSHTFKLMHRNFGTVSQLLICTSKRLAKKRFNHMFCFRSNDKLTCELSPDLQIPANRDRIVFLAGSCNGIVCYYDCTATIFLSNPATREFRQLPSTIGVTEFFFQHIGVGFGFESSNIYDFKLLRLLCLGGTPNEIRAEMFTLSSNTWRQLDWGLSNELVFRGVGLFCANSFHFIMQGNKHSFLKQLIVCCDIATERFKTMDFPPKPKDDDGSCKMLMAFKGCLSSVYIYNWMMNYEEKPIEIWVMKDYGVVESWTKLYTIGLSSALPLCFWMDQDDLLLMQFKTDKLVSCHLTTLHVESVQNLGYQWNSRIVIYKETLVSII
ncbi:hypothetical protein LIER_01565 [Lithospermum erythrorhizon]|uniref:F-box domain-containing protein n=1 Tax=Lithospermum erythrorhizon TaxID=34254 RepID=A0AAV3NLF9_LITER